MEYFGKLGSNPNLTSHTNLRPGKHRKYAKNKITQKASNLRDVDTFALGNAFELRALQSGRLGESEDIAALVDIGPARFEGHLDRYLQAEARFLQALVPHQSAVLGAARCRNTSPPLVSSPVWTYDDGVVPLITFGEDGFYRPLMESALRDAGVPFRVAFSGPSTASVLSAVEAGIGIGLLSTRSISGDVIDWPRAAEIGDPPSVVNVARAARGATSDVAAALIADIRAELGEVPLGS